MQHAVFWIALMIESIGAGMILVRGIPIYQGLLFDPDNFVAHENEALFGWLAVCLIQIPHWCLQQYVTAPTMPRSLLASTITAFMSRLLFIFAAALYSVLFLLRYDEWEGEPFYSVVLALAVVFSAFCYCRDLEDLSDDFRKKQTL